MAPTVLITGCSPGGIGHDLAKEYHSKGLIVYATARRVEVLSELASLGMKTLALDVANIDSIRSVRDKVSEENGGKLDILVNNAGQIYSAPSVEQEMDTVRALFETNVFGVMNMVQEFSPLLIASKGQIINLGSLVTYAPFPFRSSYNASKAALHTYNDILRLELKPFGVDVVKIVTGVIKTGMFEPTGSPAPFKKGSLYEPIRDIYPVKHEKLDPVPTPSAEYAKRFVSSTLGKRINGEISIGSLSTKMWLMSLLPLRIVGGIFADGNALTDLETIIASGNAGKKSA